MPWYIPLLIFLARICDVSIGTVRIIVVIRGNKMLAAVLGFIEITIWLFAVSAVIANIRESLWTVFGYASGFAMGTLVGMWIEEKLALGNQMIRIVNTDGTRPVAPFLRAQGFIVTHIEAAGATGRRELSFLVVPRKKTREVLDSIYEYAPEAFVTVEDVRTATSGTRKFQQPRERLPIWRRLVKYK